MAHLSQYIRHEWLETHPHEYWAHIGHVLRSRRFWMGVAITVGIAAFFAILIILARYAEPVNRPFYSPYMF
jgi:hypothetical protein